VRELVDGADFAFWDATATPAAHFATIYRRRAEHVRRAGLDARGLDDAVERFENADVIGALAIVQGSEREYPVFLTPDADAVVACLSVPAK
jgi:hypothetical protein